MFFRLSCMLEFLPANHNSGRIDSLPEFFHTVFRLFEAAGIFSGFPAKDLAEIVAVAKAEHIADFADSVPLFQQINGGADLDVQKKLV